MTIVVVQCGAKKVDHPAPARDLYCGNLFRKLRQAAERIGDAWYIASAKHGLIEPVRLVVPYDATLPAGGDAEWR